jgi:hypothetical protein
MSTSRDVVGDDTVVGLKVREVEESDADAGRERIGHEVLQGAGDRRPLVPLIDPDSSRTMMMSSG